MIRKYPETRREIVTETLAGISFSDPYRWLEQDSEEVRQWQRTQAALSSSHVAEWPAFDRLRQLVIRYSTERYVTVPRCVAGRWFRTRVAHGASQAQVVVADEPLGEGRVLFDPTTENARRPPYVSWISPSPDGRTMALGVCTDGSENNTIRLIDIATARILPNPPPYVLMDNWTGGVQWLPDSSGFFFSAITGAPVEFKQRVYLHRMLPVPRTDAVDVPWIEVKEYRMVSISRDGRYAVALERLMNTIPVAVARLGEEPLRWRRFVTSVDGTLAGHVVGDNYIGVTDIGAPRGRVVAVSLNAENPNDPGSWRELVAESEATLRTVTPVGEALYLTEFVDTYSSVRILSHNGRVLGRVPLPDRGAVGELPFPLLNVVPKGHPDRYLFAFSSFTVSPGIYSHVPGELRIETLQEPQVRLEDVVVDDRWAVSADGTRIPYHIVRRTNAEARVPRPALVYAYGGYKVPLLPQFPGPMAAIVATGTLFVHAHLRGGFEFGRDWWEGGRMANKQNSYDDLYAVAEDLIEAKISAPDLLAVTGHSHGGLMAGVAATQRPDLWKAVVPRVPVLDLIGCCREPYGLMSTVMDRALVEDPEAVHRLATYSPYHLVRDGVCYPAIYLDSGDTDPRCPPWHARKFAARLQRAAKNDAPILLHVWENVGHGWATDKSLAITQNTEWLAFVLRHLGVSDWSGD